MTLRPLARNACPRRSRRLRRRWAGQSAPNAAAPQVRQAKPALFLENLQLQTSYKPIRMEIPHTSTVTNLNGTMPPDKKNILIISFSWIVDAGLGL